MQNSILYLQQEKVDMDRKYQDTIANLNHEITRLKQAEDILLTRLSKIAGDRFTHDNVNIADLSDADRPTKLSETYSELYDNEWTDAFDELTENLKLSDEAAIRLLLKILMICMHSISLSATLSFDEEKSLKNIWRAATLNLKDESLKLLCANLLTCLGKPETEMPKTAKYLTCCTELCWKMGVQEKPMHLDVNAEKQVGQEKRFDTDKFRAYTKTGKYVAYVVWPALLLHEGGAMLAKGIAQGCRERVSSNE
ncbi:hypothetical protein ACJMK2_031533 [Sinanodonta woodiana]|uniref:Mitochondria-eating protein C-terminal domain-containing protein n=1 Tax=Sinanodonta woodiana TaxID=1069815 RepID=A0ABD3WZ26_SINWO